METDEFRPWDVFDASCPTRQVLNLISMRWTSLIVGALANETLRFGELGEAIGGISRKSLTKTLRALEGDGLVHREVFAEVPPRTEYRLTPLGRSLIEPLSALRAWSEGNIESILAARDSGAASAEPQ